MKANHLMLITMKLILLWTDKKENIYFVNKGRRIIVLLCGGDKSKQQADIKKAKELAKEI